jgi:hypothetical protein
MGPLERRGKRLFLILATFIILDRLVGVGLALHGGWAGLDWLRSVVRPIGVAMAVGFLWQGDVWLRWAVGAACVVVGAPQVFVSGHLLYKLAKVTPPKATGFLTQVVGSALGVIGLIGLFYLAAGLLFLFSPSMWAFFRYQREGRRMR